jgi:hypothetical protein
LLNLLYAAPFEPAAWSPAASALAGYLGTGTCQFQVIDDLAGTVTPLGTLPRRVFNKTGTRRQSELLTLAIRRAAIR